MSLEQAKFEDARRIRIPDERLCATCLGYKYVVNSFGRSRPCPENCSKKDNKVKLQGRSQLKGDQFNRYLRNSKFHPELTAFVRSLIETIYSDHPGGFIYIHGPNGTGKTYIMQAAINEMIQQQRSAEYYTTINLMNNLRAGFSSDEKTDQHVMDRMKQVTLLCLDEFGREKGLSPQLC